MNKLFLLGIIVISCFLNPLPASAEQMEMDVLSLHDAIETAVKNNFSVKEAVWKQKSAIQEKRSARADFFVKASASYSYTSLSEDPVMKNGPVDIQVEDTDQYHWNLTLIQPLFKGFALKTRYDMSQLEIEIKNLEKKQVTLDLTRNVKTSYFNILLTQKMLMVADDAVKSLKAHEEDAGKLYDQQLIPYNDLLRSRVALADAIQDREKARASAKIAVSRFNILLDFTINRDTMVKDIEEVVLFEPDFDELVETAMKRRPVLKVLHLGLKNLENVVKLTRSSYYPEIDLISRYEQNGDDPRASDNEFGNTHNSSITLQAKWMFFEWGKTRADILTTRYKKQALVQKIKGVQDNIRLEVKNTYLKLYVAKENIKTAREALGQARENFRITNLQYLQQVATSTEVIDARVFLTRADTNNYKALYGYMTALGELERVVCKKLVN